MYIIRTMSGEYVEKDLDKAIELYQSFVKRYLTVELYTVNSMKSGKKCAELIRRSF